MSTTVTLVSTNGSVTRHQRRIEKKFLASVVQEVIAEIEMEDEAERNGTLNPELLKERLYFRSRMQAMMLPVDEVAENIRLSKQREETKAANQLNTTFFADVTLEEMEQLQRMDSD
jgi:hypothetical protein